MPPHAQRMFDRAAMPQVDCARRQCRNMSARQCRNPSHMLAALPHFRCALRLKRQCRERTVTNCIAAFSGIAAQTYIHTRLATMRFSMKPFCSKQFSSGPSGSGRVFRPLLFALLAHRLRRDDGLQLFQVLSRETRGAGGDARLASFHRRERDGAVRRPRGR